LSAAAAAGVGSSSAADPSSLAPLASSAPLAADAERRTGSSRWRRGAAESEKRKERPRIHDGIFWKMKRRRSWRKWRRR